MAVPHAAHAKENGEAPSEDSSGPQELDAYSDLVDLATLDTSRQYTIIRRSGSGAFGEVYIADWHSPMPTGAMVPAMQHSYTRPAYVGKRIVAIKRCRVATALTQGSTLLNELHALRKIPAHPNTIALYDIFRENNKLHIVFECMEGNLYQLIKSRKGLPMAPGLVASVADQMFRGIAHVHKHGFFHRDMKPENVLITTLGVGEYPLPGTSITRQDVLVLAKVADFGLARSLDSKSPYSGYISTRWYRAPEVLLRSPTYAAPIDVWALAAITAEMVMLEPLFPGANELDQLNCIIRVLGTLGDAPQPPKQRRALHVGGGTWKEAQVLAERLQIQLPGGPGVPFESLFASKTYPMLVDLLFMMLRYDPHLRYTMSQCLQHPFFTEQMAQFRPIRCMMPGKGHAEPAPPEASDGQNLSDHDSPAMSMESDEGFLEMVDEITLSGSEGSPMGHFASATSSSPKSPENEDTTTTHSSKLSDSFHSLPSKINFMSLRRWHSRTRSPILWSRSRQASPSSSSTDHLSERKKNTSAPESLASNDNAAESGSQSQSQSLPTRATSMGISHQDLHAPDAKQAARLKREEELRVLRERSRVVMQKREALLQSNYGTIEKGTRASGWSI